MWKTINDRPNYEINELGQVRNKKNKQNFKAIHKERWILSSYDGKKNTTTLYT